MIKANRFIVSLLSLILLSSCGRSAYNYVDDKLNVVATTTILGDLATTLGGDKVSVKTLMGVGIDPHLYTAKVSDTNAISKTDFIVYGGLHLEGKMSEIFEYQAKKKPVFNSGDAIIEQNGMILKNGNVIDPHVWFNVENWMKVSKGLTNKYIELDPENKEYYQEIGNAYYLELESLHNWVVSTTNLIKEEEKILVTAHDAFAYFGEAYGFRVKAIQGISTDSETSVRDIEKLVNLVIENKVKSIFIESSVPQKTIHSVIASARSRGYTLKIGGELYSDSLGDGENAHYINAIRHNINIIVDGLK